MDQIRHKHTALYCLILKVNTTIIPILKQSNPSLSVLKP